MRGLNLIILLCLFCLDVRSQTLGNYPFKSGEEISYDVYYNLAFVWVDAADVSFMVKDTLIRNDNFFFFKSFGVSKPNYDWVFKVRDTFKVVVEKTELIPLLYQRNTREGGSYANNYYLFDNAKKKVYSKINNNKVSFSDTLVQTNEVRDVLSSVYHLRTLSLNSLSVSDTITITTIMDNELIGLTIIYCGKEIIEHKNGQQYETHKLKTNGIEGSIFDKDSEIFVWVSNDENKIPIKIESEILVGSVQAYLKSVRMPKVKQSKIIRNFLID